MIITGRAAADREELGHPQSSAIADKQGSSPSAPLDDQETTAPLCPHKPPCTTLPGAKPTSSLIPNQPYPSYHRPQSLDRVRPRVLSMSALRSITLSVRCQRYTHLG